MQRLFQYNFTIAYVMSTYRLVELSAYHKKNVPHKVLLIAAFVLMGAAKLQPVKPIINAMKPSHPGAFGRAIGESQTMGFARQSYDAAFNHAVLYPMAEPKVQSADLAALLSTPEHTFNTHPSLASSSQPPFHRYTLAGQGLDHSLTTPVRGLLNKLYNKGRTPRNKQIYRTGVF